MLAKLRTVALSGCLIALAVVAAVRCGGPKKKTKPGAAAPTPTGATVPAQWDGKTDWSESVWEVIEE